MSAPATVPHVVIQIDWPIKKPEIDLPHACVLCAAQSKPGTLRCTKHTGRCISCSAAVSSDTYLQCAHCWATARAVQELPASTAFFHAQRSIEEGEVKQLTPPVTPTKDHFTVSIAF